MKVDATIIGAGVIGLAVAVELSAQGKTVFVVEKNTSFGRETSSRNSEVIHAGIYYPQNSLKARFCVDGNRLLYHLCRTHRIPHNRCGKLIVATTEQEEKYLHRLRDKAEANGVETLDLLSKNQVNSLEPGVKAVAALFSPATGVIDSHRLMRFFVSRLQKKQVHIIYQATMIGLEKKDREAGYQVMVRYPDGEQDSFSTGHVINCAGLEADAVARSMGIDIDAHGYRQHFWKGEYFSLDMSRGTLRHLVYPVPLPDNVGLGIHATIDVKGRAKLGPNAVFLSDRTMDYTVDPGAKESFLKAAQRYLPGITADQLQPEMAGIRPKLQKPGDGVRDFLIQEESGKGLPGVVNLLGIESPGLTSCLAIARYVRSLIE
ncbi:MAG: NAD(P)/FAD-dependent oxidoreductase [Desulfobacteraceae bacterium]|nr:NAD(P)/FAD-dependent oxidoreductase [Desulfobacteraceae bacterium]